MRRLREFGSLGGWELGSLELGSWGRWECFGKLGYDGEMGRSGQFAQVG